MEHVRESFTQSPQKSTIKASVEDFTETSEVHSIPSALKPDEKAKGQSFCEEMQLRIETEGFIESLVFSSDEATFHLSGKVHKHNVRIWALENPNSYVEHVCNFPKVNVFCTISHEKVYGTFFFFKVTATGNSYLDMLQLWLLPQLEQDIKGLIFQQDGAPPHYHLDVRNEMN